MRGLSRRFVLRAALALKVEGLRRPIGKGFGAVLIALVVAGALAATGGAGASSLTLAPGSASRPAGTSHTVTATFTDGGGVKAGVAITFSVKTGPDSGTTGHGTTNASGNATFTYTNNATLGTDSIVATSLTATSNTATVTWTDTTPPS